MFSFLSQLGVLKPASVEVSECQAKINAFLSQLPDLDTESSKNIEDVDCTKDTQATMETVSVPAEMDVAQQEARVATAASNSPATGETVEKEALSIKTSDTASPASVTTPQENMEVDADTSKTTSVDPAAAPVTAD